MKRNKWTQEEIEFLKKHYEIRGAKKINNSLTNHTINSIIKKARSLGLNCKSTPNITKEELEKIVKISFSFKEVIRNLNKSQSGDYYKQIKKYIEYYQIDISHFDPYKNNHGRLQKKPIEYWLQYGSKINSSHLKDKLYKEKLKKRICEKCGQGENWNGERMSLILDHINGDPKDNRLKNLRILCPNCNATLPTHCKGHKYKEKERNFCSCGKQISNKSTKCISCNNKEKTNVNLRKVKRPPHKQLIQEIKETSYVAVGKKYGVSDNAIRKWVKFYENNN